MTRQLSFSDDDEGGRLFGLLFNVFSLTPQRFSEVEQLEACREIALLRDEISSEVSEGTREFKRGIGTQNAILSEFAYGILKGMVDTFPWPPAVADDALLLRDWLRNAAQEA